MRTASIDDNKHINQPSSSFFDNWAKKKVLQWLQQFDQGYLRVDDGNESYSFGESVTEATTNAHIIVHHQSVYRDLLLNGTVGSGEAYMRGAWSTPNLTHVIRLMCCNMDRLQNIDRGWAAFKALGAKWVHRLRCNNKQNAQQNIAAHYDLSNDFFSLFLDSKMMYSSAIYPDEQSTLETAATHKLEHICRRLQLSESDHLLEIGSGWGGMAIYAAKNYGCKVTTTTISKEQYHYTCQAVTDADLGSKVTVLCKDYRDLKGSFDKLVSIEMIEAVGKEYYSNYFQQCSQLLKDDGLMLIQAILMTDQRYRNSSRSTDFIQRYIFPGGHLPSLSIIMDHLRENTDMGLAKLEDITFDYAKTLADWRKAFFTKLSAVKQLGYDNTFINMWDFYLSYCEGGFLERKITTAQLLMAKPKAIIQ